MKWFENAGLRLVVLMMFAFPSVEAAEGIRDRSENVVARLTVLDGLALRCQSALEVMGKAGMASDDCASYIKNMNGKYFQSTMDDCKSLLDWHNAKIAEVKNSIDQMVIDKPDEANAILDQIKSVKAACSVESLESYKNLLKPLATIKALSQLE